MASKILGCSLQVSTRARKVILRMDVLNNTGRSAVHYACWITDEKPTGLQRLCTLKCLNACQSNHGNEAVWLFGAGRDFLQKPVPCYRYAASTCRIHSLYGVRA